jgi:hypothetical protein
MGAYRLYHVYALESMEANNEDGWMTPPQFLVAEVARVHSGGLRVTGMVP